MATFENAFRLGYAHASWEEKTSPSASVFMWRPDWMASRNILVFAPQYCFISSESHRATSERKWQASQASLRLGILLQKFILWFIKICTIHWTGHHNWDLKGGTGVVLKLSIATMFNQFPFGYQFCLSL